MRIGELERGPNETVRPTHVRDGLAVYAIGSGEPVLLMSYPHSPLLPVIARSAEFDP